MTRGIRSWGLPWAAWAVLFTAVPLFLVFYFSVRVDGAFSLGNFARFFDPLYLSVAGRSVKLAFVSTLLCLAAGYPLAMALSDRDLKGRDLILLLFILPMWMNMLLRTYALMSLMENSGLVNRFLEALGLPRRRILYTDGAVVFGMVYNFLPFMVLPVYSALTRIDPRLLEAARDLGERPLGVFLRVTLPLSLSGVASGTAMTFMPALTSFVIPRLLGGGQYTLVGNLVEQQFTFTGDWGFGSAVSMVLMVFILLGLRFISSYEEGEHEGGGLW